MAEHADRQTDEQVEQQTEEQTEQPCLAPQMDPDPDEDSALELDDSKSSLASLTSSIRAFEEENGRTYHALSAGKYILPNDEDENDRLDMQNHHFRVTFEGRAHFCPGAETAQRVLDVGTGTGIWAMEYADEHPAAEVIGVDLSPIQPAYVPVNCAFEIDDLEKEWTWSRPFDYIFSRMMVGSFADFSGFISQAYQNLAPGGWLEMIDCIFPLACDDGTIKGTTLEEWSGFLTQASQNLGRSLTEATQHRERMIAAGFNRVKVHHFKWPTNRWPKDKGHKLTGMWTLANIGGGLEGLSMALLTRGLGWSREQVLVYLTAVRKDLSNTKIHAYWPIIVLYGEKTGALGASTSPSVSPPHDQP